MFDPPTSPVTCRFHPDRPIVECCLSCRTPLCGTCTTYRNMVPLCPECLLDQSALRRNLEIESHLQAISILDRVVAVAAFVLWGFLLAASPDGLASRIAWGSLAVSIVMGALGWMMSRYRPTALVVQVVLAVGMLGAPLIWHELSRRGGAISLAFFGGFTLLILLRESGRECFRPYYREEVENSGQTVRPSYLLLIALLLGAIELFVRTTIP